MGGKRWNRRFSIHLVILPLAAFIAVLPLILNGCSCGHDFNFHLLNWMEAARQFTHGNLHPHWIFSPAYNAGEPRFVFYPPLSWTIGAILGLLMPWTWTPIVYTWLCLTAASLALYCLGREFTTRNAALLAAAFYLVNPYTLFTAYERTAYAELLAAAWIPLLLLAILRKRITIVGIAIPIALLWLTNDPAAVMGCYALALLTLIRLFHRNSEPQADTPLQFAVKTTAGTLLGLGLAAFYILPAAYERRYVQITAALAPGSNVQNNFLFHHTASPNHNAVLNTASTIAVVLLAITAIAITITAIRSSFPTPKARLPQIPILPLAILTIVVAFLLTPLSNPIWQHVPELPFLQFPWRLLAILAAVLGLALALALPPLRLKTISAAALSLSVAAALAFTGYHLFHQYCYPEDTAPSTLTLFRSNIGTAPNGEYTPIGADNQSLDQTNPPFWLLPNRQDDANTPAPANATPGPAPTSLTLNSATPQILVLNLRDYPAWRITLNQTILPTRLHRSDGLIALPIPAGLNHIAITYLRTRDQTVGDILTLFSLAILLLILRRKRRPNP
ncbi:6-pyruvoyl-tetrahydropterin synthase-related protein [Edaphobacter sp. DSM 109919]|uniref:6-pyruvoyl-tetrahydropterin synthase-related protein n=1 Tax=Edaphobacter paludis TaxID=3035702 RepID=A0AAU7D2B0_9BACT